MTQKIDHDHSRFRKIVRGKIKQNLRKYISRGDLIGRKGKDTISIDLDEVADAVNLKKIARIVLFASGSDIPNDGKWVYYIDNIRLEK